MINREFFTGLKGGIWYLQHRRKQQQQKNKKKVQVKTNSKSTRQQKGEEKSESPKMLVACCVSSTQSARLRLRPFYIYTAHALRGVLHYAHARRGEHGAKKGAPKRSGRRSVPRKSPPAFVVRRRDVQRNSLPSLLGGSGSGAGLELVAGCD